MPSISHESLVTLFRDCPALAPELLRRVTGAEFPGGTTPRLTSAEFSNLDAAEYRADVVVRLDTADDEAAEIVIIEVQLDRDGEKQFSWPLYMTGARARFRCRATLLVITLDQAVARWCARPIEIDRAGSVIRPVVLGPDSIPRIRDFDQARTLPELAVLSAAAHGNEEEGPELVVAALSACERLDNTRAKLYADFVFATLSDTARKALETLMALQKYEYQSEFARKYVAEGREEGREEGRAEALRSVLLRQLTQRFGDLPDTLRERVGQAEIEALERWSERVIPAQTLTDIFDDG